MAPFNGEPKPGVGSNPKGAQKFKEVAHEKAAPEAESELGCWLC